MSLCGKLALWPYALELYGRPGAEPLLLELQDKHGQCVSLLIWSLWAAASARPTHPEAVEQASLIARAWEAVAVAPLRQMRRDLKPESGTTAPPVAQRIRQGLKTLEIEAERMLLQMLEDASGEPAAAPGNPREALTRAAEASGGAPAESLDRLVTLAT